MTTRSSTRENVSPEQTATIIKHALAGKTIDEIVAIVDRPLDLVAEILKTHGWGDDKLMRASLEALTALGTATPSPATVPAAASHPAHKMSGLDLIAVGKKSKARTVVTATKKAEKALEAWRTAAKALQDALVADSESAQLRKKRDELKAQLAAVEAELRGEHAQFETFKKQRVLPAGVTYKDIRAWAALNDVDCPITGRVPNRVIDAYVHAHSSAGRVEALHEAAWPTPRPGAEA